MKLGFLTACLPHLSLDTLAAWAAQEGFAALEVAAWPRAESRGHTACHLDADDFGPAQAARVRELLAHHSLTLSAIGYYENNLHGNPTRRAAIHGHLRACVDAAALLSVDCVGTFIGRDTSMTVADNLAEAKKVLPPLVDYAGERGVRLAIENCPMPGWHPDGYPANLAYSPELWEWMFELGLYLNFDPSHLVWLGIDPVVALRDVLRCHVGRVVHVQAKDTQIDPPGRGQHSIYGIALDRTDPWNTGWWRYRIPGRGDVDWQALVDSLYEHHYDGVISIEHEDPVWSGTEAKVKHGLEIGRGTLAAHVVE
ncbi:MAG TPA: sugar phosphate isomerase/epimerase [Mycobacteriales bacterium]|nr:sugar phosphate isomerase/epimerase [Mycobacteriales bacterium]